MTVHNNTLNKDVQKALSEKESLELNEINKCADPIERYEKLHLFFQRSEIFIKISEIGDPSWISYYIIINGRHYEF